MDRVAVGLLALILLALPVYSAVYENLTVELLPGVGVGEITKAKCPADGCKIMKVWWVTYQNKGEVLLSQVKIKWKPDSADLPNTYDVYVIIYGKDSKVASEGHVQEMFDEANPKTTTVWVSPVNIKDITKVEIIIVARWENS